MHGSLGRMELAMGTVATAAARAKATLLQRLARRGGQEHLDAYVQQWLGTDGGPTARL
jgi:hypothetical protein